ncbi:MAG: type IV pilin N-terminal domain-containing protein [Methanoregula sp.]|jgi:hypothetical protein|uniref:type IV pilin N-terminal domain-containing protein n=1 Tax=Methanoregula sp. TaxID=2052170 RepID=UPI0025FA95C6|nr:type IV pilin N-terminal domain-containing protein [Methanoregula sp.]MCK9632667.1 type IV pilin N-terminal domain-containing protein [Methanoregula sp.]
MRALFGNEGAVSPVIGVMLMIVVTIIIAAVVSAFAGGLTGPDKKPPVAVFSAEVLPWHAEWTDDDPLENSTGILFTEESGDFLDLNDVAIVLACGEESIRFAPSTNDATPYGYLHIWKVSANTVGVPGISHKNDRQMNAGNQFMLYADNDGNGNGVLGWTTPSEFYLTPTEICTFRIIDKPSQQTIAGGTIDL